MRNLNNYYVLLLAILALSGCKKEQHIGYGVENATVYEDKSRKTKKKNNAEYISILYTNLYQSAISPNQLYKTQNVLYSIGDQDVASEMLLSNYFNTGSIQMPSNTLMRQDIDAFVINTYKRFYLRYPSEGEKAFFKQYIQKNSAVSVEMVYTAFATSDEYQYY
ncbi:MAG: hypothetical protein EBR94_00095 [Bacteroidetes bacterium]|jgi:hypothetical protein|nr:hypothetical protein [Bacteroidota bacterium]